MHFNVKFVKKSKVCLSILIAPIIGFYSCSSAPKPVPYDFAVTQIFGDGIYIFNCERVLRDIDIEAAYAGFGINASQEVIKRSEGNAVFMHKDSFIEPETGIRITINTDGSVSSTVNDSIQGRVDSDGSIAFYGLYEENSHTILISLKGTLIYQNREDLAGNEFSGEYRVHDSGTGRIQIVQVNDGLYMWDYETPEKGDFTPWPVTVKKDGTFTSGFEMTVKSVISGISESVFNTVYTSEGKLGADGSIIIQNLTVTNGTSITENQVPAIFEGVRMSTEDKKIFTPEGIPDTDNAKKNSSNSGLNPKVETPDWYSEKILIDSGFCVSCGTKTYGDESTAVKIAESIAAGKIVSMLGLGLNSETETEDIYSGDGGGARLYELISTVAARGLDYDIIESSYDEKTGRAFVKIKACFDK